MLGNVPFNYKVNYMSLLRVVLLSKSISSFPLLYSNESNFFTQRNTVNQK